MIRKLVLAAALTAVSLPAAASNVQWQTRFVSSPQSYATASDYKTAIDTLVAAAPTSGYGDASIPTYTSINNATLFGANSNIAFKTTIDIVTTAAGVFDFQFGVDYGKGGAVFVDGVSKAFSTNDLYWAGDWSNGSILSINTTLPAGAHRIVLYGIENCCDGAQAGRWRFNSGSWSAFSRTDGLGVPEPGMIGLLGAGIAGLALVRRRKAERAA